MCRKCYVATGRSVAADVLGSKCGYRRARGHREEPVRSILSTPIPPPIDLSIHQYEKCISDDATPVPEFFWIVDGILDMH